MNDTPFELREWQISGIWGPTTSGYWNYQFFETAEKRDQEAKALKERQFERGVFPQIETRDPGGEWRVWKP